MATSTGPSMAGMPNDSSLPAPTWLFVGGIIAMITAIVLLVYPSVGSGAVTLVTGICLMIGGVAIAFGAVAARGEHGMFGEIILGLLLVIAGFLLSTNLLEGTMTLTAVLIAWLFIDGLTGAFVSVTTRRPGRGVMLVGSLLSLLLGVLLLADWPTSATWVLGVYAAIVLLFRGTELLMAGLAMRQLRRA